MQHFRAVMHWFRKESQPPSQQPELSSTTELLETWGAIPQSVQEILYTMSVKGDWYQDFFVATILTLSFNVKPEDLVSVGLLKKQRVFDLRPSWLRQNAAAIAHARGLPAHQVIGDNEVLLHFAEFIENPQNESRFVFTFPPEARRWMAQQLPEYARQRKTAGLR